MTFRILFAIGVLALAALGWVVAAGWRDGTLGPGDRTLWAGMLAAPAAVLGVSAALRARGRPRLAMLLLLLLAVPAVAIGLVMGLLALASVHWR